MAKYCPILKRKVVYLDCLECEDKKCQEKEAKMEIPTISKEDIIDTLRSLECGQNGYSLKDERLEGAYILASELTGLSVDALSESVSNV